MAKHSIAVTKDREAVFAQLKMDDGGRLLTRVDCRIHMPVRFAQRGLGMVGAENFCYGCFAVILNDGKYAVVNANSLIEINPTKYIVVEVDGVDYYEFYFDANTPIFKSMKVLVRDEVAFNALDEFLFKGKLPWYINYPDGRKLFRGAKKGTGLNIGQSWELYSMITALMARDPNDKTIHLRFKIKSQKDMDQEVSWVPLHNVFHGVSSTFNRLAGSYMQDGIISALVNPSDHMSDVEKILRA